MIRRVIEWTIDDVVKDYANYLYIEMYFLYVDVDNNDLFYEIEKNINEDLFKFLDLDVVN
jgi:hypothetical protein